MKLSDILLPSISSILDYEKRPRNPLWQQRQSCNSDFCRAVVANGYMTEEQMQQAARRYRLGCSRKGGVIFWQIDMLGQTYDGKIMYYRSDCHRDHQRHPQWVSNLLKRQFLQRFPDMEKWMPASHHCLFGTHLLETTDYTDFCFSNNELKSEKSKEINVIQRAGAAKKSVKSVQSVVERPIAVVEAEKTAVILSAHYPQFLWLAAGGLTELTPQKLFPLRHHRIVLFPDTDPDQTAYNRWYAVAQDAHRQYGLDIIVSSLLERRATKEQKQRKIDLVDFIF